MSKLKEEELIYWLSQAKWYHPESDREERKSEQAYQQIKERIQSYEEHQELTANYIDIVIDLYDQLEKKRVFVTKEFVEKWVGQIIFLPLNAMEHWSLCLPKQLKEMLKEAGVEIAGK